VPILRIVDRRVDISRPATGALDALADVARDGAPAAIERSLAAAREVLGMQLAYVTAAGDSEFRFHAVDGDAAPFGDPAPGKVIPRSDTLCDRMRTCHLGLVVPDVA
jgi:hypothetical protein